MTHENTVNFYDNESSQYSRKRYEGLTETYFQYLFKERRRLFLGYIAKIAPELNSANALEIGCADGVIVKKLLQKMPDKFDTITGVDVSPKMIEQAKSTTENPKARYFLRGEEPDQKYGLIIELGVHAQSFEDEMIFVSKKLNPGGYFMHSVASRDSLHVLFKLKGKEYVKDYLDYPGYEQIIRKYFDIVYGRSYGLFIPKLWAFPGLARVIQPILESMFRNILPNLFHERIYLLRKK